MGPTLALIFLFLMPIGCSSQACEVLNKFPKIEENSPVGTLVTEILLGTGYTVNVEPRDTFMMNGSQLQMSREVDFEVDQLVRATLTCNLNEGFAGIEDLVVEILDVNDNECKFKRDNYSFIISEALQVNSSIGNAIEAEDADQDTLYYTLSGNVNSLAYFRLSSETNPVILVNKRLDFDDAPNVNLNLTVRDRLDPTERPIHSATASIMIDIVDVDDKPPFFMPCTAISTKICINYGYTGSVTRTEQETGPLILSPGPIYAVDGDWGIGASVEYSILNGNNDNVFNVHTTSGNITMNKAVNTLGNFILQVMAYQTDDQAKYSTTSVIIEVKEKNNFLPTFEKSIYYGMIPSDSAIGTFVLDLNDRLRTLVVFAADDDFPDKQNPSLVYTIDNSTAFRILRDGYILTDAVITTPGTIVLQVSATDSSTNEKATTLVSVEVIAATTTIPTTTTTTTTTKSPTATNIGTTTTTTPGTGTTTTTTKGTGTTTTSTPGTGTTTTKGTGTTTTPTPGTGTTTTTTKGTGTTTTSTPETGTTTTTTKGTGTTTTSTPGTGTTTTTTKGTGTTTTSTPGTGTTTTTTKGTGTTTTSTPGTGTTTTTTKGTGTTTTSTPGSGTTTITTKGTGTTTTSTPGTGTTTTTTKGTGTTTTSTPGTGTTTTTTKGTGTTTTSTPGTGTTTTTTKGTGTTTTSTPGTGTTTTTTMGTGTTTTSTPGTGTITTTTKDTGRTITSAPATGIIPTTSNGISTITTRTSDTGTPTTISPGAGTTQSTDTRTEFTEKALSSYTATDMAALGASLGAILALCLVLLGFLIHKQYGNSIKRKLGRGLGDNSGSPQNSAEQLINDTDDPANDFPDYGGFATTEPVSTSVTIATDAALGSAPSQSDPADNQPSEIVESDDSDDKKVKSILTKELKEDAGYKAVWFREDASPEVVVIEGVEDGEADDYDNEDNFDNQQGDDEDDDDDEEDLDPTFNLTDNQPENSIL
ncbi:cadherin-related family member 5 isoform X1 [Rana temporaria]|uniref:cadherin-related family member 5 isoform X1 n=1 Tax=Rana temporaria TaxID=8407 RepID=UPI001AADC851|nr:cadherin-related family member 5 isoform X1 [Rana temporaria]